jgi:hypothetical protein
MAGPKGQAQRPRRRSTRGLGSASGGSGPSIIGNGHAANIDGPEKGRGTLRVVAWSSRSERARSAALADGLSRGAEKRPIRSRLETTAFLVTPPMSRALAAALNPWVWCSQSSATRHGDQPSAPSLLMTRPATGRQSSERARSGGVAGMPAPAPPPRASDGPGGWTPNLRTRFECRQTRTNRQVLSVEIFARKVHGR